MAIKFEDATLPTQTVENEFTEMAKHLAANVGKVVSYVRDGKDDKGKPLSADDNLKIVEADGRLRAQAGNALTPPVSFRKRIEILDDGKSVKVYVWTNGKKITRKPKTTDAK